MEILLLLLLSILLSLPSISSPLLISSCCRTIAPHRTQCPGISFQFSKFTFLPGFSPIYPPEDRASCAPSASRTSWIRSAGSYCTPVSSTRPSTPAGEAQKGERQMKINQRTNEQIKPRPPPPLLAPVDHNPRPGQALR